VTASSVGSGPIDSAAAWAEAACAPLPGSGLVVRIGSVLLVTSAASDDALAPIVDHAQIVAANGGNGRQLVRGFALQLSTLAEDPPPFVAVAPIDRGLAVFAVGEATAEIDGQEVSGRDSLAWVEKVVPWPVSSVSLYVAERGPVASTLVDLRDGVVTGAGCWVSAEPGAGGSVVAAASGEEEAGVPAAAALGPQDMGRHRRTSEPVRGAAGSAAEAAAMPAGAAAVPVAEPAREHAGHEHAGHEHAGHEHEGHEYVGQPAAERPVVADVESTGPMQIPVPAEPAVPPGPPHARRPDFGAAGPGAGQGGPVFESVVISSVAEAESLPKPLPVVEQPGRSRLAVESAPMVKGVFCKNNHFNDPRMLFCGVCGINMVQQTPVLVDGARPPLGVIVLDDGAVFQLDGDYLLGRDPEGDERSETGRWRAIRLSDNQNAISRVHARIELRNWDVVLVDDSSTNGTFYADPKAAQWLPVPRGGDQVLQPGWRIRIGHRTLAFNTHRG
jgi:hypothetical protein